MDNKPDHNRQVYYKNRNIKGDPNRNLESNNDAILDPSGLIAEAGNPKAYYFPGNLSSYATGNILRFSIFKYQGGGYKAELEEPGGADAIAQLPLSEKVADIYLPEPSGGQVTYNPSWDFKEVGGVGKLTSGIMSGVKNAMRNSITDTMSSAFRGELLDYGLSALGKLGNSAMGGEATKMASELFQIGLGYYMQEYKEQLFSGISPRGFTYSFNLIPTAPRDLILISNIIQLFKWASVPGLVDIPTLAGGSMTISLTNKLFESPEIFQIRHMTKVKGTSGTSNSENDSLELNPWINKHLPAVLTKVDISYGSDQANYLLTYVQDRSTDKEKIDEISLGAPLMYQLTLSFNEMTVITKAAINNGY